MTRISKFFCCLFISFAATVCHAWSDKTRVAFYYGDFPPFAELHAYNVVVVHPSSHISPVKYDNSSSQLYAYVSIGELDPHDPHAKKADPSWRIGKNTSWNSRVMDMSNPAWRDYIVNQIIGSLWDKGYRGFFLDTLDSYQLLKLSAEKEKEQIAGLIDLIKRIKAKYPEMSIITNRGFELMDDIHQDIKAVAAESLYAGWNNASKSYVSVSANDREWLLNKLNSIHQKYNLPIIIIDYLPQNQRVEAKNIAKKISALGFIPWVADAYLENLGVGTIEIIPRKILLLYDIPPEDKNENTIPVFAYTAFYLEYMGFVPVLQFVDESLTAKKLDNTYAGVITWFSKPIIKKSRLFESWLDENLKNNVPILFMQNFGISLQSPLLRKLGIEVSKVTTKVDKVSISYQDKSIGYEIIPRPINIDFHAIKSKAGKVLLELTTSNNYKQDAIVVTPWGGYVLEPFDIVTFPNGEDRWIINPFIFFKQALRLPDIPVPDITTENGRRILMMQIDGDAFISRVSWKGDKYAGELILEEILQRYKFPTTVSIVQREFEILKQNPELEERLIKVAKEMFALPWVELATHTYSHPLKWWPLQEGQLNTPYLSYPDNNYLFDYQKEIAGSADYINQNLAPKDKKVKVILWSGDANVQEKPLALAYQAGLKNINGMSKINLKGNNSISNLGAFGVYMGDYFHVYSPLSNEYEYTDNWANPLYAFEKLIHTLELAESPTRYKPISIYYHFYTATDQAALRALIRVYDWAIKQPVTPMMVSDYIDKVMAFNETVIARYNDGSWLITNNNPLREFRWDASRGNPELQGSQNVIGFNTVNKDMYIHLGSNSESILKFTQTSPSKPFLIEANAPVTEWSEPTKGIIRFGLKGYVPLRFKLANMNNCQLHQNNQLIPSSDDNYFIKGVNDGTFEIQCIQR